MPTYSSDDNSWLSGLSVPLILGGILVFFVVLSTGNASDTPSESLSRRDRKRRRAKRKQDPGGDCELIARNIPVEIIEHIIDYVADEPGSKRTLKACALTGRAWLPRTRWHLHHTLVVHRGGPDPYKLRWFPEVARCIRRVYVRDGLWHEVTNSVLVKLGHVECLHLSNTHRHPRDITAEQFPLFPALQELRLENVAFRTGDELLAVLRQLPKLSRLSVPLTSVNYFDFENARERAAAPARVQLPLQFVHLNVRPAPGRAAREILAMARASLTELSIRIVSLSGLRPAFELLRALDLAPHTALERMRLHFYWSDPLWYYSTPRAAHDAPLAAALLAAVHAPAFHALHLRIVVPGGHENLRWLRFFDIGFLDAFAEPPDDRGMSVAEMERATARAKGLRSLHLELKFECVYERPELERIQKHVEQQLPALKKRNILQIELVP